MSSHDVMHLIYHVTIRDAIVGNIIAIHSFYEYIYCNIFDSVSAKMSDMHANKPKNDLRGLLFKNYRAQ